MKRVTYTIVLATSLLFAGCGDDGNAPVAFGPSSILTDASVSPPPVLGDTPGPRPSPPTPTVTPRTPSPTITTLPEPFPAAVCDLRTAYACVGGPNDGAPCRPADSAACGAGGSCRVSQFVCKGGLTEGAACVPPRLPSEPSPCGEGGRCMNSELTICTELACPTISRPVAGGRVDITCAGDGCRGELRFFDPVTISGIGLICVRPVGPDELQCPLGRIDCDGGELLDYDLIQDHNIGACSGNEQCAQMCEARCRAMSPPRVVADSGCTGFCEGGLRAGERCDCDAENLNCRGDDCPGGSCNGKDNPTAGNRDICGCQCLETGGSESRPGALNLQVPAQITVESDADPECGVGPALITLPPQCIPLTTENASGVLLNANNTPGRQIPREGKLVRRGVPVDCESMQRGIASGMNLVGNISFFDSTIGDIEVELDWFCR